MAAASSRPGLSSWDNKATGKGWCERHFSVGCHCEEFSQGYFTEPASFQKSTSPGISSKFLPLTVSRTIAASMSEQKPPRQPCNLLPQTTPKNNASLFSHEDGLSKPCFQKSKDPSSSLHAIGWICQKHQVKTRTVWYNILASLVEGRRPGEATTFWVQRPVTRASGKHELDALHHVPLERIEKVSYVNVYGHHCFTIKRLHSMDELCFRTKDRESAQMWVFTIKTTLNAESANGSNGISRIKLWVDCGAFDFDDECKAGGDSERCRHTNTMPLARQQLYRPSVANVKDKIEEARTNGETSFTDVHESNRNYKVQRGAELSGQGRDLRHQHQQRCHPLLHHSRNNPHHEYLKKSQEPSFCPSQQPFTLNRPSTPAPRCEGSFSPSSPHSSSRDAPQQKTTPNKNRADDDAAMTFIKCNLLNHWALKSPMDRSLRPIDELICTIHTVFPPAFGLPTHDYFKKWKPISPNELTLRTQGRNNGTKDTEKLKKATRKVRFFLHPDKLPNDLNLQQKLVCKLLWDITSDACEECIAQN